MIRSPRRLSPPCIIHTPPLRPTAAFTSVSPPDRIESQPIEPPPIPINLARVPYFFIIFVSNDVSNFSFRDLLQINALSLRFSSHTNPCLRLKPNFDHRAILHPMSDIHPNVLDDEEDSVTVTVQGDMRAIRQAREWRKRQREKERMPPLPHKKRKEWPHFSPRKAYSLYLQNPLWSQERIRQEMNKVLSGSQGGYQLRCA